MKHWVRVTLRKFSLRVEPASSEVKGERSDHCATEAPCEEVVTSKDGKVRRALVKYRNFKVAERNHEYTACEEVVVSRSVHRLALLVPVEYDQAELESDK